MLTQDSGSSSAATALQDAWYFSQLIDDSLEPRGLSFRARDDDAENNAIDLVHAMYPSRLFYWKD